MARHGLLAHVTLVNVSIVVTLNLQGNDMTTQNDIDAHMSNLTDEQLLINFALARADLEDAATHQRESEWHEVCFAGAMCYALEAEKRGLRLAK